MPGEMMLRVASVRDETVMERIRDALDVLGMEYEHIRSEPDEDTYPQNAYFYVSYDSADDVDYALQKLSEEHGFDAEVI
jgi:hypothetical protein